jgi:hypothetical protein
MALDLGLARSKFPSLATGYLFADNAGGSQVRSHLLRSPLSLKLIICKCLKSVADRVYDYLTNTNVQLGMCNLVFFYMSKWDAGADYSVSVSSTTRVESGAITSAQLMNCSPEEIVFAASSTMALENLARSIDSDILDGEELIVTGEHEGRL